MIVMVKILKFTEEIVLEEPVIQPPILNHKSPLTKKLLIINHKQLLTLKQHILPRKLTLRFLKKHILQILQRPQE